MDRLSENIAENMIYILICINILVVALTYAFTEPREKDSNSKKYNTEYLALLFPVFWASFEVMRRNITGSDIALFFYTVSLSLVYLYLGGFAQTRALKRRLWKE